MTAPVTVIGAGLAGCEAAWQLAKRGIPVKLHEMKPEKMTPAHHAPLFGELVCSNSLRSDQLENAEGRAAAAGFPDPPVRRRTPGGGRRGPGGGPHGLCPGHHRRRDRPPPH